MKKIFKKQILSIFTIFIFIILAAGSMEDAWDQASKEMDYECGWDEWNCGYGHCVPMDYVCDGEWDCEDGSDETNCGF